MKKTTLFILLLFLSILTSNLFACGGCVDSSNANSGAKQIINTYDNADDNIAKVFGKINDIISKINKQEKANLETITNIKNLIIEDTKQIEKIKFTTEKIINIKKRRK